MVKTVSVIMLVTLQEIVDETVMLVAWRAATNHSNTMMRGLHILMDASTSLEWWFRLLQTNVGNGAWELMNE